ncbi:AAA family ATPase [Actinosynnema pretiosum subsp. pretiosum]|uniref:Transcriptional regulator, LuxR family n=2 Tax=Actinosynnema TaxID=40566 RepID=C6W8V4_ACTMD|nr:LuxR family transcriptional regulator [Actinosynnema mirum]ACU37203.1 transcriptional regulator, LuxR family [Actinosynnema mirum DSM 43827]AXX30669.1 LuxR-family transcriptional regulator [Actinosynnema pretiosum subsp. pretiosum]QUF05209.1 AAA family ATPase [Actinosynnema pretiosum subsp. pretiosum]
MELLRAPEIQSAVEHLAVDLPDRAGRAFLVDGPPACGKTTALRRLVDRIAHEDHLVLTATCTPPETELPFGVLKQLLASPGMARVDPRLVADLGELLAPAPPPADDSALLQLYHSLCAALIALSEEVPLVIAVDDVRHGDTASLHVLLQLVHRLDTARVRLLLTDDLLLPVSFPPLRYELLRLRGLGLVRVAPLPAARVREEAVRAVGADVAKRVDFAALTGGNPLLLHALAVDVLEAGEPREIGYGNSFLSCLHRNEPLFLDTVRALAVLGGGSASDLGRLSGHEPEQVAQVLNALRESGLLAEDGFRHDAARRAVVADTPVAEHEVLHRRAARLLRDQGGAVTDIADHLLRAGRITDPWAADLLVDAAELVVQRGEPTAAVALLQRALDCSPDRERRTAVQARLATAEWLVNPSTSARHHTALLAAFHAGRLSVRDSATLMKHLRWAGNTADSDAVLARLRTDPRAAEDVPVLEHWLTSTYPGAARPRTVLGRDVDSARSRADLVPRANAVLLDVLVAGDSDDVADRAEAVLRELRLARESGCYGGAAVLALSALLYSDRADVAASWCEQLLSARAVPLLPMPRAQVLALAAESALRRGDHPSADELAREALTVVSPTAWGVSVGLPLSTRVLALTRMGRYDEAAAVVAQPVPNGMFGHRNSVDYLYARGHFFLARERPRAALGDFLLCGEQLTRWGLGSGCAPVPWRTAAAEAWLAQGNRDQARVLIHEQLGRPGTDSRRARGQALRLLAATSSVKRHPQLLREAVAVFEAVDDKYELARTLRDLGRAQRALGENKLARRVIRRGWHVARMCEAAPLCEELMPTADGLVPAQPASAARRSDLDRLTSSEHRVAALAASGLTNREIAVKLYVTHSTVEQHLTRVFRKLGIKQREQLPPELSVDRSK